MAGTGRIRVKLLALAALLLGAGMPVHAQSVGSLTGRLTDLHSTPLSGATVLLRNQATGAEARTTTAWDGVYRFTALEPGQYTIEADSATLGHGLLKGIQVSAGHEARIQTAMQFGPGEQAPARSVFLKNRPPNPPPPLILNAAAPVAPAKPLPATVVSAPPIEAPNQRPLIAESTTVHEPPPARHPVISAEVPAAAQPAGIAAALPRSNEVTRPASAQSPGAPEPAPNPAKGLDSHAAESANLRVPALLPSIHSASSQLNLAMTESIASGVRASARWSLPPQSHNVSRLQTASQEADPASSAATTTLSGSELQSLPATGRRWQDFVLDTPAASAPAGSSQASFRGAGQQPSDTTIDGASTRLAFGGMSSSSGNAPAQSGPEQSMSAPGDMGQAWSGGRGFAVSETAIRQVRTSAGNVEAEGARAAGGRVNVETQSGTNALHGQFFFFDRQNIWGARNPFTQWVKETAPATFIATPVFTPESFTPPDHEVTWGFGLGSHIRRNKLFWFAALDGNHRNDPGLSTVKHPYLCANPPQCNEQTGFFAQPSNDQVQLLGAQLGTNNSAALAKYSQMLETLDGLLGPAARTAAQWVGFARIDWEASERHRFTFEGIGANWNSPGGGLTQISEVYGNHSLGSSQASQQWLLARWEAFLTPNLLAVTQASAGRAILGAHAETPSAFEKTLNQNVWGQLPQIVVDSRYGFTIGNPSRFGKGSYPDERLLRAQESVDWVHGSVLIKAGFDVGHNADVTGLLRNQTGTYYYSNVENFVSDALTFGAYGLTGASDQFHQ